MNCDISSVAPTLARALAKVGATDDMSQFTQLNKEYSEITPIVDLFQSLQDTEKELFLSILQ